MDGKIKARFCQDTPKGRYKKKGFSLIEPSILYLIICSEFTRAQTADGYYTSIELFSTRKKN